MSDISLPPRRSAHNEALDYEGYVRQCEATGITPMMPQEIRKEEFATAKRVTEISRRTADLQAGEARNKDSWLLRAQDSTENPENSIDLW